MADEQIAAATQRLLDAKAAVLEAEDVLAARKQALAEAAAAYVAAGGSVPAVAKKLGLTRGRVYQLAREARKAA